MRLVVQRVKRAAVSAGGECLGSIGQGLVVLVGVGPDDVESTARSLVEKLLGLRIFADAQGKTNLSALDVGAEWMIVSQFTLYADLSRGRRPGFTGAAPPAQAETVVARFTELLRERGARVATGRFGAEMELELVNDGPFTLALSTDGWA